MLLYFELLCSCLCYYPNNRLINGDSTSYPVRVPLRLYGGKGGNPWEEKVFSTIRSFVVYHKECVHAIQIYYEKNGKAVWSPKHGGDGGTKYEVSSLNSFLNLSVKIYSECLFKCLQIFTSLSHSIFVVGCF